MRCTQQSINLADFGQESLGRPMTMPEEAPLATATTEIPSDMPCAKLKMTGSGQLFMVPKPVCRIGHDGSNDVVLSGDETVARFHAQITFDQGEYILRDLGTKEGTFLNGQKISFDPNLYDGDHLKIGSFKFYFISDMAD